jgi:hypothetical protein
MGYETIVFLFGSLLILVGIIGGGFEVRELKLPPVRWPVRIVSMCVGLGFVLYSHLLIGAKGQTPPGNQPRATTEDNRPPPAATKPVTQHEEARELNRSPFSPKKPQRSIISIPDIESVFKGYMESWNSKNYERNVSYLSADFCYVDQEKKECYQEYISKKRRLFDKYDWISVDALDVKYSTEGDVGVVEYYQHYNSPHYESSGRNRFLFRKTYGQIKIFREEFVRDSYKAK